LYRRSHTYTGHKRRSHTYTGHACLKSPSGRLLI